MKKFIITAFLFIVASLPFAAMPEPDTVYKDGSGPLLTNIAPSPTDAVLTYTLEHPNSQDSIKVVTIVNGVLSTVTIFAPRVGQFLNRWTELGAAITASILGIWRWISIRRIRRRNPGVDIKIYD